MGVKKAVDIERLLQWAYRDELPKQTVGGLTGWESDTLVLGARVDDDRNHGDPGFPVGMGEPHPDALKLDWHIRGMDDVCIQWPATRDLLMADYAALVGDDLAQVAASRSLTASPSALIRSHAILRNRPVWDIGPPMPGRVTDPRSGKTRIQYIRNGEVVIGLTKGNRYGPFAHCLVSYEPSGSELLSARFEYWVWHQALEALTFVFLQDHLPTGPAAATMPWVKDDEMRERKPTIFENSAGAELKRLPLTPKRPITLPPVRAGDESWVDDAADAVAYSIAALSNAR